MNQDFCETTFEASVVLSFVRYSIVDGYAIASMSTCAIRVHDLVSPEAVRWFLHESCFQSYFAFIVSFTFFAL